MKKIDEEFLPYLLNTYQYCPIVKGLLYKRKVCPHVTHNVGDRAGHKHINGYWYVKVKGKLYKEHRLIFMMTYGRLPNGEIDHIDRNLDNNDISNLREVSRSENCRNRASWGRTSQYRGVSLHKKTGRYQASIRHENKGHYIGLFDTEEEAAQAFDVVALQLRGNTAILNFPKEI